MGKSKQNRSQGQNLDQKVDNIARSMQVVSDAEGKTVLRGRIYELQKELLASAEGHLSTLKAQQDRKAVNVNVRVEIDRLADSYSRPFSLDKNIAKIVRKAFIQGAREGFRLGRMPYGELLTLGQKNAAKLDKAPKKP